MHTETTRNDWNEMKGKIKAQFGKLTDESIESLKGNLGLLSEKLQHVYGYAKDKADVEYAGFKAKLHAATEPEKTPAMESEKKPAVVEKKTPSDPGSQKVT